MSTRKSANRANTDSPVSTASVDSSSGRSTATRSSLQTTTAGSDPDLNAANDINITETKRPRRTNVRTPTTPTTPSNKKKSDDNDEILSITGGADTEDDKSVKSIIIEEIKSEDDKKSENLNESPVRASRKRKVFDKTAIVTRKSAMDLALANSTKRVLRCDRRNSTGKLENTENETKKRNVKKSLSSTPEPSPTSTLKRRRLNSTRLEEGKNEKLIKIEQVETEDLQKLPDEDENLKENEIHEIIGIGIKEEIEEEPVDVPLSGIISKELEEEQSSTYNDRETDIEDEKLLENKIATAEEELVDSQKISTNLSIAANIENENIDIEEKEIKNNSEISTFSNGKKALTNKKDAAPIIEGNPEKPKRGRPKKKIDTSAPVNIIKKPVGRKRTTSAAKDSDKRSKINTNVQEKLEITESNDINELEKSKLIDNNEMKNENIINTQDIEANNVGKVLIVDTTAASAASAAATSTETESPSTSSDKNFEKAASLSPELISEGVSVISVKQFYKKPEFLENNLGIEKDPKLGEIVQEVEKTKEEPCKNVITVGPSETTDKTIIQIENSPNCSGDSLKEEEQLILDESTEDDASRSTSKFCRDDEGELISTTEIIVEETNLPQFKRENDERNEKEETESNTATIESLDTLQNICDTNSINTAVEIDQEENGVYESDIETKDKISLNKNIVKEMQEEEEEKEYHDKGELIEQDDLQKIMSIKTDVNCTEEEIKDISEINSKTLIDAASENVPETEINHQNIDSEEVHDEGDKTEDTKEICVSMDEGDDESKENKENLNNTGEDEKDNSVNLQIIVNSPKKMEKEEDELSVEKKCKKLLETPETLKQKENHLKHLGLLTHKAAVEAKIEKQRRRKLLQTNLLGNDGGNNINNNKKNVNNGNDINLITSSNLIPTNESNVRSNGTATGISAGNCNKDSQEYTGTLKTVIKLNRQSHNGSSSSSTISNENKRNKTNASSSGGNGNNSIGNSSRQSLKMTFQKGRGRNGNNSDKDQNHSSNSGDDTYYTIQNESEESQPQETITHGRKSYNRYHTTGVCTFYITHCFFSIVTNLFFLFSFHISFSYFSSTKTKSEKKSY